MKKQMIKKIFKGKEGLKDKITRYGFNAFPSNLFTGGQVTYISPCKTELLVTQKRNWRTRGLFGNIFGGLMYAAIDTLPMVLLNFNIDRKKYLMWDKSGEIIYKKPAYCKYLFTHILITPEHIKQINDELENNGVCNAEFRFDIVDGNEVVYASIFKVVHIEDKAQYHARKQAKGQGYETSSAIIKR